MFQSLSTQTDTVGLSRKSIFSAQYTVWYPSHHVPLNTLIIYWQGGECNSTLREASQIKSHQSEFCCVTADHSWEASHFPSLDAWAGSVMRGGDQHVRLCFDFTKRIFLPHAGRGRKLDQRVSQWPFSCILRYQRNGSDLEDWYGSGFSYLDCGFVSIHFIEL